MQYTSLGKTGLKVSRICLGTMTYGSPKWRDWVLDEEQSKPFIRRAARSRHQLLRHRRRLFDGRQRRGPGQRALKEFADRATKSSSRPRCHGAMGDEPNQRGLSRKHILHGIDNSPAAARHGLCRPLPDPPLRPERRRSRKPWTRCTTSCARARRATSARRRCMRGSSRRSCTPPNAAGRSSSRCRTTTTSSIARKSAR